MVLALEKSSRLMAILPIAFFLSIVRTKNVVSLSLADEAAEFLSPNVNCCDLRRTGSGGTGSFFCIRRESGLAAVALRVESRRKDRGDARGNRTRKTLKPRKVLILRFK